MTTMAETLYRRIRRRQLRIRQDGTVKAPRGFEPGRSVAWVEVEVEVGGRTDRFMALRAVVDEPHA